MYRHLSPAHTITLHSVWRQGTGGVRALPGDFCAMLRRAEKARLASERYAEAGSEPSEKSKRLED